MSNALLELLGSQRQSEFTVIPELDSYIQKDGTQHIMIRVTVQGRKKRLGTRIYVMPHDWDPVKKEVRNLVRGYAQQNARIKSLVNELKRLDVEDILNAITVPREKPKPVRSIKAQGNPDSFFDFMERKISELPSPASRKNQTSVLKKLRDYRQGEDLLFEDITHEFLVGYRNHLEKDLGNGSNTVHHNLRKLKTSYDEAIFAGLYEYDKISPFKRIKVKKTKSRRLKLTPEKMEEIELLDFPAGSPLLTAKNVFLFSFYLQGIRVSDLLQLKWGNVSGNRLYYTANKTKKGRSRLIISKAQAILDFYHEDLAPTDYIFPYLAGYIREEYTEDDWLSVVDSKNSVIRKHLTGIAELIGLPKLSMHVARHSFADIARKKSGNVYAVSDALDHGDLRTTEGYFANAEPEENDDFVRQVLGE